MDCSRQVLKRNVQYLLSHLSYMETKKFVEAIQVSPSTVTRWKAGATLPDNYSQNLLCEYFGIEDFTILKTTDLSRGNEIPIPLLHKKEIIELINQMDEVKFGMMYPKIMGFLKGGCDG